MIGIVIASLGVFLVVFLLRRKYSYWERKGFPCVKPSIPLGSLGPVLRGKKSMSDVIRDLHLSAKDSVQGIYLLCSPSLMITDPDLVRRVLVTDFDHFYDRGLKHDEENDSIGSSLFSMKGERWKRVRAKFSPTFSSGKLKAMYPLIHQKMPYIESSLDKACDNGQEVQLKIECDKLMISIWASIFYGFELNVFEDPSHIFAKIGQVFLGMDVSLGVQLRIAGSFILPDLMTMLKVSSFPPKATDYTLNLIRSVVELRKSDPETKRNDFVQTIMELLEDSGDGEQFSLELCTAQAILFYAAGVNTSADTSSFCIYELSKRPEIMAEVLAEVDELFSKCNGELTYESLNQLPVLDKCIAETLRKYPGLPLLNRECTKDYPIPGSDRVIEKGTKIIVSVLGLHMDERNFPNPKEFDPSRDLKEGANTLPYYPLGGGGRYCMGSRLGFILVRLTTATLLHRYKFTAVDQELQFNTKAAFPQDVNFIRMGVERRIK